MIRIEDNELRFDDDTYYDLKKASIKRVMQGLNFQLKDGSLTNAEYEQCIKLLEDYEQKKAAPEVPVQEQIRKYLENEKLTVCLKKIDDDFVEVKLIGKTFNLSGKAYKVPINNSNEDLTLSIMYLVESKD